MNLPGYDNWKTAGPPEHEMVCPECGRNSEDIEELTVLGLEQIGLLGYGLYTTAEGKLRRRSSLEEQRKNAHPVTIWKCSCGLVLSDDGFITAQEYQRRGRS
jgi:hypothetical protein